MAVGSTEDWGKLQAILGLAHNLRNTVSGQETDNRTIAGQIRFTSVDNTTQEIHTSHSHLLAFSSLELACGHGVCYDVRIARLIDETTDRIIGNWHDGLSERGDPSNPW